MNLVVSANDLCKSYPATWASNSLSGKQPPRNEQVVSNCSLKIKEGSIYGLLGANGAGKTTIFKMLSGLILPTTGEAKIFGLDIVKSRTEIQSKIGTMIDTPVFYENLSAFENLKLHLAYMDKSSDVGTVLKMVGLDDSNKRAVSKYSLGMRQRLAIARAIVHKPKLLMLDEPTNGLDPAGIKQMRELFVKLVKEDGMTILISSHILAEIGHICDTIAMISKGQILSENTIEEIERNQSSLEDYYMEVIGDK